MTSQEIIEMIREKKDFCKQESKIFFEHYLEESKIVKTNPYYFESYKMYTQYQRVAFAMEELLNEIEMKEKIVHESISFTYRFSKRKDR